MEEDLSAVSEPALALSETSEIPLPVETDYAHVVNGILQVTPDIAEEITEAERGQVVSLEEIKGLFSQWLD